MSFAELKKAQPQVLAALASALKSGRLPHALLFLGPENSLQHETAEWLASELFGGSFETHPDLKFFGPADDSRTIKVEDVRHMISEAHFKPFQAPVKLFVVEPAEAMSEISQNALLKTLEEPPARTYFILICHAAEKLLATIRSRAQTLHFRPIETPRDGEDELARVKSELWERVLRGRAAKAPDLGGLSREEAARTLEYGIGQSREALLVCVNSGKPEGDADEWIRRIETLAAYKEKIDQSVNIKLALAVLWEEL